MQHAQLRWEFSLKNKIEKIKKFDAKKKNEFRQYFDFRVLFSLRLITFIYD